MSKKKKKKKTLSTLKFSDIAYVSNEERKH